MSHHSSLLSHGVSSFLKSLYWYVLFTFRGHSSQLYALINQTSFLDGEVFEAKVNIQAPMSLMVPDILH